MFRGESLGIKLGEGFGWTFFGRSEKSRKGKERETKRKKMDINRKEREETEERSVRLEMVSLWC